MYTHPTIHMVEWMVSLLVDSVVFEGGLQLAENIGKFVASPWVSKEKYYGLVPYRDVDKVDISTKSSFVTSYFNKK